MEPLRNALDESLADNGVPVAAAANSAAPAKPVPFGKPMRALFPFASTYRNLNNGSYGTFPTAVADVRAQMLAEHEARAEIHKRLTSPRLVREAREALLPLLSPHVHLDEVVFVTNATTGVNVVLNNLAARWSADAGDAVFYFTPIYAACHKTLLHLDVVGRLHAVEVPVAIPADLADNGAILEKKLRDAAAAATARGLKVRMAVFDTIVSAPGVLLPWERLVRACRALGILSLIDGAHSIGQIDLSGLGAPDGEAPAGAEAVQPDFFVTNCHKWLYVPRSCAMMYVPFKNQHLLETCLPTSHGYRLPADRTPEPAGPSTVSAPNYFSSLFADVGTMDYSPWACVPAAVRFRQEVCGGEAAIRQYCIDLVRTGSDAVAEILGTEVMDVTDGSKSSLRECAMANVRLPFTVRPDAELADGADSEAVPLSKFDDVVAWIVHRNAEEADSYFRITYYQGAPWVRLSAQIYLAQEDFVWGGNVLEDICTRVRKGEWKSA